MEVIQSVCHERIYMGDIRICTSGFSFKSWKGKVYPADIKDSQMLSYYVNQFRFDALELNYTYYRLPSQKGTVSMVKQTPAGFVFTVKLFGGITHDPWKSFPPASIDKSLCKSFIEGIKPLIESGKLGCVLAQFPSSLLRSPEAWGYLLSIPQEFPNIPLIYEFRNKGWVSEETVKLLEYAGIGLCVVDEPQIGSLMPIFPKVTSRIAYFRLHGRNKKWYKNPDERYNYRYSREELKSFLPIIQKMREESEVIYVALNNCDDGNAVINAKELKELLGIESTHLQSQPVLFD